MSEFDLEFWGEPIHVYTDADAVSDGVIADVSFYGASFNNLPINRITDSAAAVIGLREYDGSVVKRHLEYVAERSKKDREGADAWGIFEPDARLGNAKMWLVCNEVGGYTLMLPSDY